MAESDPKPDCNDTDNNVVFIDTNLDTYLALLVSHNDTVSHLKKRILLEHPLCFPKIGQIQIHSVKVKRKGYFYHLSDSMLVRSAFNGASKSWFLSVDASALEEHGQNQQLLPSSSPKEVACLTIANNALVGPVDNVAKFPSKGVSNLNCLLQLAELENKQDEKEVPFASPCASEHTGKEAIKNWGAGVKSSGNDDIGNSLPGSIPETEDQHYVNNELPSLHTECEVDRTSKGTTKDDCNVCEDNPSISVQSLKKKRKSKRKRDNNFQAPQSENKQDEEEESHFDSPSVSKHTGKEVVQKLEKRVKSSDNNDITKDDCNVCEEDPSISVPIVKQKRKSKKKKEDTMRSDTSKENISSVDNPLGVPSKRVSSFNKEPQSENKQDEKEESRFASPCVSEHNLEKRVKSSGNNDTGISLPGSIHETEDRCYINGELPSLHIECEVDRSSKGINNDDHNVFEEDPSISMPSLKKKGKSKRKKANILQDDNPKENVASADNSLGVPSKKMSNLTNFAPQLENKKDEEDTYVDDESMKEASKAGPAGNKKHVKRKRSLTRDSKEMLEVETASQKDEANNNSKESKDQFEFNNDKTRSDVQDKHDKVPEDVSETRAPAKKKQKGKVKHGDKSLSKERLSMISDFNVEKASHHFLEDQQKIKNSSDEQAAEHFKDADPLRTNVLDSRRIGKKISSNCHETPVVTSSRKDHEADSSSIQGDAQQEISEDGLFSKGVSTQEMGENRKVPDLLGDFNVNETTIDNMEIGTDASKEGAGCKVHPSDVNEPKELTEDNVNIVTDHSHKSQAVQSEGTEEGREESPQNNPNSLLLEECPPSNQDNTGANIGELNVTSKVVDGNGMIEPIRSEKKKRGIRKGKDSGGGPSVREDIGLVDASDNESLILKSLKATNCDPTSGNTEIEENPKNIQLEEVKGTVLSATEKQDDFSADNAGSLEQINTEANAKHLDEHVNKRQRKKSNNKETSASKSVSNRAVSSLGEKKKPHVNASGKSMDLEKQREHFTISNSKLEGSKKKFQNKAGKASGQSVGGEMSNAQQKKSLLSGAIFKDDSSGTSEDEGKVHNSDASTRTPSDNSLLSDFSDGDSKASLDSQQNGLHGAKKLENGGRSASKASLSGTKGMAIDRVLRSSRRYKKAKIAATQTESQLEFVPDSLADT